MLSESYRPETRVVLAGSDRRKTIEERRLRRVAVVWGLLFFDVLGGSTSPILPIPHKIAQILTQSALAAALVLALTINPKGKIRPNLFLGLYTLVAVLTLMMSIRFVSFGTTYRAFRLITFLGVLWLLTPWFGRRDRLLLRSHVRVLVVILATVWLGFLVAPKKAYPNHRLGGALWSIPSTQVAHYMAELVGLALLFWICGLASRRRTLLVVIPTFAALLLTHTRTALLAAVVGLLVAGLSLFTGNRRVRKAFIAVIVVVALVAVGPSAFLTSWLARGESSKQLHNLTGRTNAWQLVLSNPRPLTNKLLGSGLSNDSVYFQQNPANDGKSIDSSWISTYQNQGLLGDVLIGFVLLTLLIIAASRPRGPTRAIALFIIVYCLVASITESGLGDASPYLLDLTVASSLLALPVASQAPKSRPRLELTR